MAGHVVFRSLQIETPTGLVAAVVSSSQIDLTWSVSTNAASYRIYRSTDGSNYSLRTTVTAPTVTYSDTGLSASTLYYYKVDAVDGASNASAQSAAQSATTSGAGAPLFFDDFDYNLPRVQTWTTKRATLIAQTASQTLQYSDFKDNNRSAGALGYIYTATSVTGSSDPIPGASGRVLVLEALPNGGQTDFYVNIGDSAFLTRTIPADCWVQYWYYANRHGAEMSDFSDQKFLYPMFTQGSGTTTNNDAAWLLNMFSSSINPSTGASVSRPETGAVTFRCQSIPDAGTPRMDIVPQEPDNYFKAHPYLSSDIWLRPNRWYLIRHRLNVSQANGQWQVWWREYGQQSGGLVLRADYTVGTPAFGFSWNTATRDRGGPFALKIPTTVNANNAWVYLADLAIADDAAALPVYGSY